MTIIKDLDFVRLLSDIPQYGLKRGDKGTVLFYLRPDIVEVEFRFDDDGESDDLNTFPINLGHLEVVTPFSLKPLITVKRSAEICRNWAMFEVRKTVTTASSGKGSNDAGSTLATAA